jgi:hypothetical protein
MLQLIQGGNVAVHWRKTLTGTPFRLLGTGSRQHTDLAKIHSVLDAILEAAGEPFTLIEGGAPGADSIMRYWAEGMREQGREVAVKTVEARWRDACRASCTPGHRRRHVSGWEYCPAAGNYRNEEMCQGGADLCVGFPLGRSAGTYDCLDRALKYRIPIITFPV